MSRVSPTNCKWDKGLKFLWSLMPLSFLEFRASFKLLPSSLIIRIYRKEDRGFPCLIAQEGLKVGDGEPFIGMEKKVVETKL
jgi:hypothetical protein